jgi:hypothetical protein
MRWLLIGLLVSLGALLLVAAGVARHIWLQRAKLRHKPPVGDTAAQGQADESDVEIEV